LTGANNGERAGAGQRLDEAGGLHCRDQRGMVLRIDGFLDDVLGRIHRGAADFDRHLGGKRRDRRSMAGGSEKGDDGGGPHRCANRG
jgi:hypothetical protein